jgi:hypothetical protein
VGVWGWQDVIGQCFAQEVCADGVPQIFISPRIADSIQVLGTLLHELIHACVGWRAGHGKQFSQLAWRLGLVGPPTATTVGPTLVLVLQGFVSQYGPCPHASIRVRQAEKKPGSWLRLFECVCEEPVKLCAARNELPVQCLQCGVVFVKVE